MTPKIVAPHVSYSLQPIVLPISRALLRPPHQYHNLANLGQGWARGISHKICAALLCARRDKILAPAPTSRQQKVTAQSRGTIDRREQTNNKQTNAARASIWPIIPNSTS